MDRLVLITNVAVTGYLTGLVWAIQIVHYPLLAEVGREQFVRYHALHRRLIAYVVTLPMAIEIGAAAALLFFRPAPIAPVLAVTAFALVLLASAATFFVTVPIHNRLSGGHDRRLILQLVNANWIRTFAWSARFVLLLWATWELIKS